MMTKTLRNIAFLYAGLLGLALVFSCTPSDDPAPEEPSGPGVLEGIVTGYNGSRLEGVRVTCLDQVAETSAVGVFHFDEVEIPAKGKKLEIAFSCSGYEDKTVEISSSDFVKNKARLNVEMDFFGWAVKGYVMDALGNKGIAGVEVTLGTFRTKTDGDGFYCFSEENDALGILPQDYHVAVKLSDRNAGYDVLEKDFLAGGIVTVPTFYSGYDVRDGVKIQKVGDMISLLPAEAVEADKKETSQGLAIDGDNIYIFHNNGQFFCYSLSKMRFLYLGDIDPYDRLDIHCNDACFLKEKLDGDSEHPLLLASGTPSLYNAYVYDITSTGVKLFGIINPPGYTLLATYSYDPENDWLYVHNENTIHRYRCPKMSEFVGGKYALSESDHLASFTFSPSLTVAQGACPRGNKFFMPSGYPPEYECSFYVYDFEKNTTQVLDIADFGIEPEGIDEKDGWFYVVFNNGIENSLYRFQFPE